MAYGDANDFQRADFYDIHEWNLDKSVKPHTMVRGIMGKNSSGSWEYLSAAGNRLMISGTFTAQTAPLSADSSNVSAIQGDAAKLRVSVIQGDAGILRMSSVGGSITTAPLSADSSSVSAKQESASNLRISAFSNDAGLLKVSSVQDGAAALNVSAKSNDAALLRVSVLPSTLTVSAHEVKQSDAASLLVSAKSGDANQLHTSAVQGDAGLLRVSARVFGDTTGNWTVFRSLNLSASQAVKATAGAPYGYYLWNADTKHNYVKFFNTSGAINVGTDTPILTVMLPPSAAANVEFTGGLKGFTNGIGIAALSAVADNATTASPASAVGGNIFYV